MNSRQRRRVARAEYRAWVNAKPQLVLPSTKPVKVRVIRSHAEFLEVFGKPNEPFQPHPENQLWCQRVVPEDANEQPPT